MFFTRRHLLSLVFVFTAPLAAPAQVVEGVVDLTITVGSAPVQMASFAFTGGVQTWTVPETGLYRLNAYGAQGSPGAGTGSGARNAAGGAGAYARGDIFLTAGTVLRIYVGGTGIGVSGGWNGGGSGQTQTTNRVSGGGGGATDVRIGGTALANRVLVAGGGGGGAGAGTSGGGSPGGGGGGGYFGGGGGGGYSGTMTADCANNTFNGSSGTLGVGGSGGNANCTSGTSYPPNAGAPAGLNGSDGGAAATRGRGATQSAAGAGGAKQVANGAGGGGGGGGSSWVTGTATHPVTNGAVSTGARTGNGLLTIDQYEG